MARKKAVAKELTPVQLAYMQANVPASYHEGFAKALSGTSMAMGVKMMCRQCNAFENAAARTRECHITSCPLWPYRR